MGNHTPYDDVFRTLTVDCSSLLLPVINEVFGERYTGEEKIMFSQNEHFLRQQDGHTSERITDSSFLVFGRMIKRYHFECQSTPDNSILVRMFEYDVQIALEDSVLEEDCLTVRLPASAVLFLRDNKEPHRQMKIRLVTPEGSLSYRIFTINASAYDLEEIFRKKLYFLIPFYIFRFEKDFEDCEQDEERLKALQAQFLEIRRRLEELSGQGQLDEYTRCTIMEMSDKTIRSLTGRYTHVREGVKQVMGGQVLEYEAKTILNRGRAEGLEKGLNRGRAEGLKEGLSRGRTEGKAEEIIALYQELGKNRADILECLQKRLKISLEKAEAYYTMFVQ